MDQATEKPRKKRRIGRIILIVILLIIAGATVFVMTRKSGDLPVYSVVPDDAVYIIETNNLSDGWETVSSSKQWTHLLSNEYFAFLNDDANYLDSLIRGNRVIGALMKDRRLVVATYMISASDYDFLFVVDLKKAARFSFLSDLVTGTVSMSDYTVSKRDFEGLEIIELLDRSNGDILYIVLNENLMACSYDKGIIERSVTSSGLSSLDIHPAFIKLQEDIRSDRLFNFYFNYKMLDPFMKVFFSESDEMAVSAGSAMQFTGLEATLRDERVRLEGLTLLDDSMASYLSALAKVRPGRSRIEGIISERTALYLSMTFDDYMEFFEALKSELQQEDSAAYLEYLKNMNRLEKVFGIDLEEDFFSWIGNEIAYVKLQPSADTREKDFIIALHTKDIKDAMEGMDRILTKVKRRTPWQVQNVTFQNYEIKYLKLKGFFRLFFGKLFGKLDEPYFTFIDDYVVFSNTPSTLIDLIEDHTEAKTLQRRDEFMDFRNEFSSKANVSIFIRTPKVYNHLYYYANAKNRRGIEANKDLILSYSRIGMQLTSGKGGFETLIIADHEEAALLNDQWEDFERSAEDLFNREFELYEFKVKLENSERRDDGFIRRTFPDSTLKAEGLVLNGQLSGLWRTYYPSGNIQSAVTYNDGRALGVAYFYYDRSDNPKKAEVFFRDDQIIDIYREFYRNGARKAMIDYRNGKTDGDAEFYYESGALKIKGQYRNGEKSGRWKHYSETGQLLEREKVKE